MSGMAGLKSFTRRSLMVAGLAALLTVAPEGAGRAEETRIRSKNALVDWWFHADLDGCRGADFMVSASDGVSHETGSPAAETVMSVFMSRSDICTGTLEFSGHALGPVIAFRFDKSTNTWELRGTISLVDDVSGEQVDLEVALASRGTGPVYFFKDQTRIVDVSPSRDVSKNHIANQLAEVLPGSYARDDSGNTYSADQGTSAFTYSRSNITTTIIH